MKKYLFLKIMLTTLLASVSSQAAVNLEGDYKFKGFECSSGVAAKYPLAIGGLDGNSVDASLSITASQVTSHVTLNLRLTVAQLQEALKQLNDSLEQVKQMSDGPEKQKSLNEINKAIEENKKMAAGSMCFINAVSNYSISGNKIHTTPVSSSGTCQMSESKETDGEFTLIGNTLRVTVQDSNDICPVGDTALAVYERIQ